MSGNNRYQKIVKLNTQIIMLRNKYINEINTTKKNAIKTLLQLKIKELNELTKNVLNKKSLSSSSTNTSNIKLNIKEKCVNCKEPNVGKSCCIISGGNKKRLIKK